MDKRRSKAGGKFERLSERESQDDLTDPNSIIAAKVGGIPHVVDKLISFMDFHSLKATRIVSQYWRAAANEELSKRDKTRMTIKLCERDPVLKYLKKRDQLPFPCYDFVIDGLQGETKKDKRLSLMEIQESIFPLIGPRIKTLTLKGIRIDTPLRRTALFNLLNNEAPNLQDLSIDGFLAASTWDKNSNGRFELVNLKRLSFMPDFKNVEHTIDPQSLGYSILLGCPNLQEIENIYARGICPEFWSWNINSIKKYNMDSYYVKPKDLQKLANAQPKLECLSVVQEFHKPAASAYEEQLLKILDSSQSSLKTLNLANMDLFCLITIKNSLVFENLETLILYLNNTHRNLDDVFDEIYLRKNHRGDKYQKTFPKLKHVTLEWGKEDKNEDWMKFQPLKKSFINNLGSVESLKLGGIFWDDDNSPSVRREFQNSTLTRVMELFPNAKNINLSFRTGLDEILPTVIELWPKIESLTFSLFFDSQMAKGSLDKPLSKLSTLEELKNLDIEFDDSYYAQAEDSEWIIPFSKKTLKKAAKKLRVQVHYDTNYENKSGLKDFLEPLTPFVQFHHF